MFFTLIINSRLIIDVEKLHIHNASVDRYEEVVVEDVTPLLSARPIKIYIKVSDAARLVVRS